MIPYVRKIDVEYGRCDQVSLLIRRVIADNPGPFTFTGTGTYIVGRGRVAVIDPGPDLADHLAALMKALEGETVTHILVTHHHADHSPLAAALKARTGAPIVGCALAHPPAAPQNEGDGVKMDDAPDLSFHPDVSVCGGGPAADGPGWTLEAVPTPGHTSNHICYALKEENALFSGDHIMGWSTTIVAPPDGDMAAYMQSLKTIRDRDFSTIWPTHGPPIRDVAVFLDAYRDHRLARERQILDALAVGPARIADLVPRLYADVDARLHPAAARSMLANLIDLTRRGAVTTQGEPGPESLFALGSVPPRSRD